MAVQSTTLGQTYFTTASLAAAIEPALHLPNGDGTDFQALTLE